MWIFADFVWYLNLRGQFFFVIFFGGVCICMRILTYLFYKQIIALDFLCAYTIHIALSYICRYVLDLRVFLVAEAVFALKMPYFKTADNLNSSSYNADLRNTMYCKFTFIIYLQGWTCRNIMYSIKTIGQINTIGFIILKNMFLST